MPNSTPSHIRLSGRGQYKSQRLLPADSARFACPFADQPRSKAKAIVNADIKLTHFCSERRFKSDTPPLHLPTAYAAGAVSRLAFTMPAAR